MSYLYNGGSDSETGVKALSFSGSNANRVAVIAAVLVKDKKLIELERMREQLSSLEGRDKFVAELSVALGGEEVPQEFIENVMDRMISNIDLRLSAN